MATQYPISLDNLITLPHVYDLISPVVADDVNRIRDAVVAVQTELGTNPSGVSSTVKDRIDNLEASLSALAPASATYLVLSSNVSLTVERILALTSGELTSADGGAGGNYTVGLANTAVTPGAYTFSSITVDAKGRITAAANGNPLWTASGSDIYNSNAGNVGFGISTPISLVDIDGDLNIRGVAAPAVSAAGAAKLYFDSGTNKLRISENAGAFADVITVDGAGSAGAIGVWTDANTISFDSDLTWDSTNNYLGIGVAPTAKVSARQDANSEVAIEITNGTDFTSAQTSFNAYTGVHKVTFGAVAPTNTDNGGVFANAGLVRVAAGLTSGLNIATGTTSAPIKFLQATTERMRIDATGNVGIGTSTASKLLHVLGDAKFGDASTDTVLVAGADTAIGAKDSLMIVSAFYSGAPSSGDIIFGSGSASASDASYATHFPAGVPVTETARISYDGNFGIGTAAPAQKLHVVGNIKMTGMMYAGSGTVSLPSYSFASDPDTGLYLTTSNTINFGVGGALGASLSATRLASSTSTAYSMSGSASSAAAPTYSFVGDTNTGMYTSGADEVSFSVGSLRKLSLNSTGIESASTFSYYLKNGSGTASFPTYTFTDDTDTGFFRNGSNAIGISTDATVRASVSTTGISSAESASYHMAHAAGSASLPTYSFVDDTNSGIYNATAGEVNVACDGVEVVSFAPGGLVSVYNVLTSDTQTLFTQGLTRAATNIVAEYTDGYWIPGLFWSTTDNNSTKPKAGIYPKLTSSGSYLYFGTSNLYSTGITNNAVVIDYSGRVGINNETPASKLDMVDASSGTAIGDGTYVRIKNSTSGVLDNRHGIGFYVDGAASVGATIAVTSNTSNASADIVFSTRTTAGAIGDRMFIDGSGNVGIGNGSPSARLTVDALTAGSTVLSATGPLAQVIVGPSGNGTVNLNAATTIFSTYAGAETARFEAGNSRFGIGTTSPSSTIELNTTGSVTTGIRLTLSSSGFYWNIYNDSGTATLQFRYNGGANGGFVSNAADVSNIDFTGQHRCQVKSGPIANHKKYIGMIVCSSGDYCKPLSGTGKRVAINEAIPKVELCAVRNDKRVFGVISNKEDESNLSREYAVGSFVSVFEKPQNDNRLIINSLGEGAIWICNINGNFENGDLITSCEVPGYGMKQDDDLFHSYTVAKITTSCDFDLNSNDYICEEIEFEGQTYRRAFVGCTYHCG